MMRRCVITALCFWCLFLMTSSAFSETPPVPPTPVIAANALETASVGDLAKTGATSSVVAVSGQPFVKSLVVVLAKAGEMHNETQILIPTTAVVKKGDLLLASAWVRGAGAAVGISAEAEMLFIHSAAPWTTSGSAYLRSVAGKPGEWRRVSVPFHAAADYAPGEASLCVHLAFAAQTIELGGLDVVNYGKTLTLDELIGAEAAKEPTRDIRVMLDRKALKQTMTGFGGNFAIARFGDREATDSVGGYLLTHLRPDHARIGIPLKTFMKANDNFDAGHMAVMDIYRLMQTLQDRKIPFVASVWDVPDFCVTNPEAHDGRRIAPDKRDKVIAAITEWLRLARQKYSVTVPYVSFNEAEGGYSVLLTPEDARYFITRGGTAFADLALPTKWILGDTSIGKSFVPYATAIVSDKSVLPFLGPASFHGWDAAWASDDDYRGIADFARKYKKPVWCLEAGYDPQLWRSDPPVWGTWGNALTLAHAYVRYLTLAEASLVDYWQYQNDFPLSGGADGTTPYPSFYIVQTFAHTFPPQTRIVSTKVIGDGVSIVAGTEAGMGKARCLLVNMGGVATVTIRGGRLNAVYQTERMDARALPKKDAPAGSVAGQHSGGDTTADDKGMFTITLSPRSVTTLREL